MTNDSWFDDYADETDDDQIDEYEITATPNDFNVLTLFSFIESGAIRIPGFQRNYVWDIQRASKLIESLILGLPVPQLFLYEQARNRFLVIDGQQRLMSIYYFIKRRFPKKEKRSELRKIFDESGVIPEKILADNQYFDDFELKLHESLPGNKSKFSSLNHITLGDYKTQFDLRPIRNVIVKQNSPEDDDSSIYEVFNRLNTGGVNLRPQEIRTSMYHSEFYDMLYKINLNKRWRALVQSSTPDIHMKDIEILLRSFAMLIDGEIYKPSMVKFLNLFSKKSSGNGKDKNNYLESLFLSFISSTQNLSDTAFLNRGNNRFNIALFEAVFTAICCKALEDRRTVNGMINPAQVEMLANDSDFQKAALEGTTRSLNVDIRLKRAKAIVQAL